MTRRPERAGESKAGTNGGSRAAPRATGPSPKRRRRVKGGKNDALPQGGVKPNGAERDAQCSPVGGRNDGTRDRSGKKREGGRGIRTRGTGTAGERKPRSKKGRRNRRGRKKTERNTQLQ
ncbi:unnamed protein product [Pleuronectes platessa]|uniref:Uncharacterized protein n=1 Tax=Pleuronectes platessa TaxID=8262 RepID=A0A9N7VD90_PLEPL|nr:unnamed protein product [Pleuronectes platessa]